MSSFFPHHGLFIIVVVVLVLIVLDLVLLLLKFFSKSLPLISASLLSFKSKIIFMCAIKL